MATGSLWLFGSFEVTLGLPMKYSSNTLVGEPPKMTGLSSELN